MNVLKNHKIGCSPKKTGIKMRNESFPDTKIYFSSSFEVKKHGFFGSFCINLWPKNTDLKYHSKNKTISARSIRHCPQCLKMYM